MLTYRNYVSYYQFFSQEFEVKTVTWTRPYITWQQRHGAGTHVSQSRLYTSPPNSVFSEERFDNMKSTESKYLIMKTGKCYKSMLFGD